MYGEINLINCMTVINWLLTKLEQETFFEVFLNLKLPNGFNNNFFNTFTYFMTAKVLYRPDHIDCIST